MVMTKYATTCEDNVRRVRRENAAGLQDTAEAEVSRGGEVLSIARRYRPPQCSIRHVRLLAHSYTEGDS